jgi:hypothetical protein
MPVIVVDRVEEPQEIIRATLEEACLKKGEFFSADPNRILQSEDRFCRPMKKFSFLLLLHWIPDQTFGPLTMDPESKKFSFAANYLVWVGEQPIFTRCSFTPKKNCRTCCSTYIVLRCIREEPWVADLKQRNKVNDPPKNIRVVGFQKSKKPSRLVPALQDFLLRLQVGRRLGREHDSRFGQRRWSCGAKI